MRIGDINKVENLLSSFPFKLGDRVYNIEFDLNSVDEDNRKIIKLFARRTENRILPFATLSMNVEGIDLEENEFILKNWNMNEVIIRHIEENTNYFVDTGKRISTNFGESPVWKFNI